MGLGLASQQNRTRVRNFPNGFLLPQLQNWGSELDNDKDQTEVIVICWILLILVAIALLIILYNVHPGQKISPLEIRFTRVDMLKM